MSIHPKRALFSLLFVCLFWRSIALAEPTPDDLKKAETLFEEADRYYKAGSYEEALKRFTESYVLSASPELLFNIAQCQRNLKRHEEALRTYKKYLQEVSLSDEILVESVDGVRRILRLLPDLSAEKGFPKSAKKAYQETIDLAESLLKRALAIPRPSPLSVLGTEGAQVFLDDQPLGALPLSAELKPGKHRLIIKKDGFLDWSQEVSAPGDGAKLSLRADLVAISIIIEGEEGAEVFLNQELKGRAPLTLQAIKAGSYRVQVKRSGYADWSTDISLPAEKNPLTLKPELSAIVLTVEGPSGAELSLDGEPKGKLPVTIEKPSQGRHKLQVKQEGFEIFTKEINVTGEKAQLVEQVVLVESSKTTPKNPEGKTPGAAKALFGVSGLCAAGSAAAFVTFVVDSQQLNTLAELGDPGVGDLIEAGLPKLRQLQIASGALLVGAVGAGVGGVVLSSSAKKSQKAQLLVTPSTAATGSQETPTERSATTETSTTAMAATRLVSLRRRAAFVGTALSRPESSATTG